MSVDRLRFLDERGREVPDPNPVEIPAGFRVPESLEARIARLIRRDISEQAEAQGMETFDEAEDFDIDDDMFDPHSPYEEVFDPALGRAITLDEFNRNEAIYRERYIKAQQKAFEELDKSDALRGRRRGAGVSPAPSSEGSKKDVENSPKTS